MNEMIAESIETGNWPEFFAYFFSYVVSLCLSVQDK